MISLRKREHISADSVEAKASIEQERPGSQWPGKFLLAIFILSFCCRYCQATLFASVQFDTPTASWLAPDSTLLLVPAVVAAIAAAAFCKNSARTLLFSTFAILSLLAAAAPLLLENGIAPHFVVAAAAVVFAIALEAGRLAAWNSAASLTRVLDANSSSVQLLLTEIAATALGVNAFRSFGFVVPLPETMRFTALLLTATFLLLLFLSRAQSSSTRLYEINGIAKNSKADLTAFLRFYPVSAAALMIGTNTTALTLLNFTLAGKVVANIPLYSFWSAAAIGMLFGALFCSIPVKRLQKSRWVLALVLSIASCALCIYRPVGSTLFAGLLLSGFAASITCVSSAVQMFKSRHQSPGMLLGCQAILCYLLALAVALILEPRIESLSSFVFIRLLAISQLIFIATLGSFAYIVAKFRRSQG